MAECCFSRLYGRIAVEEVALHLHMHLKYCFRTLVGKLNFKYYINFLIYCL